MKRSRHNACGYTLLLTAVAVVLAMFFIFLILPGLTGLRCAKYAAVTGHPAERPVSSAAVLIRGNLLIRSITRKSVMKNAPVTAERVTF
ncbi:hypothetical protein [Morganella morganii]|uniref:hypothetical protein n=1 Tax=Morganella morganii TaxID=582 RepID=UPI000FDA294A|nr:hypothetical protein [Morganella morganii]